MDDHAGVLYDEEDAYHLRAVHVNGHDSCCSFKWYRVEAQSVVLYHLTSKRRPEGVRHIAALRSVPTSVSIREAAIGHLLYPL
jgi:hypothetical protein